MEMIKGFWAAEAKLPLLMAPGLRGEGQSETWRAGKDKMSSGISKKVQIRVK